MAAYLLITYTQFRYYHAILPEWTIRKQLHLAHRQGKSVWKERAKWGFWSLLINQLRWRKIWKLAERERGVGAEVKP